MPVVACLLFSVPARAEWLPPQEQVFPLLPADPAACQFELSFFNSDGTTMGMGTIGESLVCWRGVLEDGWTVQAGIEGAARTLLDMSSVGGNTALHAVDLSVGMPVEIAIGQWSVRLTLTHVSSHLGDGFMLDRDIVPVVYSRETIECLAAWRCSRAMMYGGADVSGGGGSDVDTGMGAHAGLELYTGDVLPGTRRYGYLSMDFQAKEESDWNVLASTELGFAFRNPASARTIRAFVSHHNGPLPFGQYVLQPSKSLVAAGVSLDI